MRQEILPFFDTTHTHTHTHKVNTTQQARDNSQLGQACQQTKLSRKRPHEFIVVKAPAIQSKHGNQKVVQGRQQHPHTKRTCVTASVQNEDKGRVYPSSNPPASCSFILSCSLLLDSPTSTPPPPEVHPWISSTLYGPSAHTQQVQTMRQEILPFFNTTHTHTK